MRGGAREERVAGYNPCVDQGKEEDWENPVLRQKILTPPFYAAWSTPCIHDCLSGLRINAMAQVIDLRGQIISGLYCAGETSGGFNQHGLAKSLTFGRIAGREAARPLAHS